MVNTLKNSWSGSQTTRMAIANSQLMHPELYLENDTTVLIVWTTLAAGVNALGFHFLRWALVLLGAANLTSGIFPRRSNVFYFLAGGAYLFVFLLPELEGLALLLCIIVSI